MREEKLNNNNFNNNNEGNPMEYIEYMSRLRHALSIVAATIPGVIDFSQSIAEFEKDKDVEIALMSEDEWLILQERYGEVEDKIYQFNPEDEYGMFVQFWDEVI